MIFATKRYAGALFVRLGPVVFSGFWPDVWHSYVRRVR